MPEPEWLKDQGRIKIVTHPWMEIAKSQMGVAEIPGPRNNPRIIEYHDATELSANDEDTSWCSSFVNWCLKQVGVRGTRSAAARSWLEWGREPLDDEYEGCVCVLWGNRLIAGKAMWGYLTIGPMTRYNCWAATKIIK